MKAYLTTLWRALRGDRLCPTGLLAARTMEAGRLMSELEQTRGALESATSVTQAYIDQYMAGVKAGNEAREQRDLSRRESAEIRIRHEALVEECTRHRNRTWEITHQ